MTKTTTTYALPDDARAEMRRVLENEFRSFLAHDPHDPDRFWGLAVDAVMRSAARAETTTAPEPEPVWPTAPLVWHDGKVWVQAASETYFGDSNFWGKYHLNSETTAAREAARRFAREAIPVTPVPTEAWEEWKRATRDLDYTPDCELIDAVDSLAQEVAR